MRPANPSWFAALNSKGDPAPYFTKFSVLNIYASRPAITIASYRQLPARPQRLTPVSCHVDGRIVYSPSGRYTVK